MATPATGRGRGGQNRKDASVRIRASRAEREAASWPTADPGGAPADPEGAKAPSTPSGLGPAGKKLWGRMWAAGEWLSAELDPTFVAMICQAMDERDQLRTTLAVDGRWQTLETGRVVGHPAHTRLQVVESDLVSWLSMCGFTLEGRKRHGLRVRTAEDQQWAAVRAARNESAARARISAVPDSAGA